MTEYSLGPGPGFGPQSEPSDAETELASWLAPYVASGGALLLQAQPLNGDPRYPYAQHDTPIDAGAGLGSQFEISDRVGRQSGTRKPRLFVAASTIHPPVRVVDPDTQRFVYQNALAGVGGMVLKSVLDPTNTEINKLPLFRPGTGGTWFAKFRVPSAPGASTSTSMHGVTFAANSHVGGALLAGDDATNANNPVFSVDQNTGLLLTELRRGTVISASRTDLRDGNQHTGIVAVDVQAETATGWVDPTSSLSAAFNNGAGGNPVTDFATSSRPVICAMGPTGGALQAVLEWSAIGYVAAPLGNIAGFRDAVIDYFAAIA